MTIDGSTALVTGSARRIGRWIALELARRGARLAIHYRSSIADAEGTLDTVRSLGVEAELFQADLTDDGAPDAVVDAVIERFGTVDILVNSASVFGSGSYRESTPEMWDHQLDTNARAPFFLARKAAMEMVGRKRGKIINIADTAGVSIWPQYLPYSISKAALLSITEGLARALAPYVHVNAVAPGPMLFPEYYTQQQRHLAVERTLVKHAGTPEDIVRAVVFLIENDYITGEVLHVDGGRHLM